MAKHSKIYIFIDDETIPIGEYSVPINFELDTRKLVDGNHSLKIVSKDSFGQEGIKLMPFTVRNGPAIAVEGLSDHDIIDGIIPLMINAYSKGDQKRFIIEGSETPHSIPAWLWVIIILFIGWAIYYAITEMHLALN